MYVHACVRTLTRSKQELRTIRRNIRLWQEEAARVDRLCTFLDSGRAAYVVGEYMQERPRRPPRVCTSNAVCLRLASAQCRVRWSIDAWRWQTCERCRRTCSSRRPCRSPRRRWFNAGVLERRYAQRLLAVLLFGVACCHHYRYHRRPHASDLPPVAAASEAMECQDASVRACVRASDGPGALECAGPAAMHRLTPSGGHFRLRE
jgi:hypothetical protein